MNVLEAVENETLESHSRGPVFESLCAHTSGRQISLRNENNLRIWGLFSYIELRVLPKCCEYDGHKGAVVASQEGRVMFRTSLRSVGP